jgi:hypothetical protein
MLQPNYANGRIPLDKLERLGPDFYLPAGTAARWRELIRLALEKYGVTLRPSPGWNGYRPYDEQVKARNALGIYAAVPGYSSHGGVWVGQVCMAIDVNNWRDLAPGNVSLAWARFVALCRLVGFRTNFVSPEELWHIGDFNDIWNAIVFAAVVINHATTAKPKEDIGMYLIKAENRGTALVGARHFASLTPDAEAAWAGILGPAKAVPTGDFDQIRASAVWGEPDYMPSSTVTPGSVAQIAAAVKAG